MVLEESLSAYRLLSFCLLASPEAQQPTKIPRIGLLVLRDRTMEAARVLIDAFHQGLRELGTWKAQNVSWRYR